MRPTAPGTWSTPTAEHPRRHHGLQTMVETRSDDGSDLPHSCPRRNPILSLSPSHNRASDECLGQSLRGFMRDPPSGSPELVTRGWRKLHPWRWFREVGANLAEGCSRQVSPPVRGSLEHARLHDTTPRGPLASASHTVGGGLRWAWASRSAVGIGLTRGIAAQHRYGVPFSFLFFYFLCFVFMALY
jgi:hypothetical protein